MRATPGTHHPRPEGKVVALIGLLATAMVAATYLQGALSVLSSFIIDEFGITRSQLGITFTAFSLTGAAASPPMGALADGGTRRVMAALFGLSAVGLMVGAAAPGFEVLLVGSVLGGLALGAGNPVTNRVISRRISPRRRGLVVGLKQAGPPLGLLAAGAVLPPLALLAGWRWALAASALIPLAGLAATPWLLPGRREPGESDTTRMSEEGSETRWVVLWLTIIGVGVALGLSAVIAFVPLYAQETVGVSAGVAGAMAAVMGLAGVVGRIGWGAAAGRFERPSSALLALSVISVAATIAIAAGEWAGPGALWVGVLGVGASMLAWHSVAWLVIIDRVGQGGVGKASGVMQVGNSLGFAVGPPMAGLMVDLTGSYRLAWITVTVVFAVTTALTVWVRLRARRNRRG